MPWSAVSRQFSCATAALVSHSPRCLLTMCRYPQVALPHVRLEPPYVIDLPPMWACERPLKARTSFRLSSNTPHAPHVAAGEASCAPILVSLTPGSAIHEYRAVAESKASEPGDDVLGYSEAKAIPAPAPPSSAVPMNSAIACLRHFGSRKISLARGHGPHDAWEAR
jgi:hypothetical protein